MPDFILNMFGPQIINWVIAGLVTWGMTMLQRHTSVKISETHAQQFQIAVTNAAGVLVNKISTGTIKGSDLIAEALKLAKTLINDNPDAVNGVGIAKNRDLREAKVAEKIMAKAAGVSVDAPEQTVTIQQLGDKVTAGPPPAFVGGSVPHRT